MLSNPRRRSVLCFLLDDKSAATEELAVKIAAREQTETDEQVTDREVLITLVHNHLPRLQDAGIIEYDHQSKEVARGECFDEVSTMIEQVSAEERPVFQPLST